MRLRNALRASAVTIVSGLTLGLATTGAIAGPVLVELFTSQGCSSCPPADAFMGELVERDDVVAISLPVDYWNYLGWEDTFAKPAHTDRQRAYAAARGDMQIYTPQMIISGGTHVVGSDKAAVDAAIAAATVLPSVELTITHDGSGLQLEVPAAAEGGPSWGTIWLVMYDDAETVDIGRGENAGRSVTYHHIALDMHRLAMWRGEALSIELPMMELMDVGADGCVVILQQDSDGLPGPVIGVAAYDIPG